MVDQGEIISDVIKQILEMYTCRVDKFAEKHEFYQYGYNQKYGVNFYIKATMYPNELFVPDEYRDTLQLVFKFTNKIPNGLIDKYNLVIPEIRTLTEERHFQLMTITDNMYLDFDAIEMLREHMK